MTRQGAPGLYTQLKQSDEMIGEKLTKQILYEGGAMNGVRKECGIF